MAFERFTETAARSVRAKISIRKSGSLGFNVGAVSKFGLDKYDFAVLFFDREKKVIGIKPVKSENEDGAHRIGKGRTGAWIGARRFVDYYGLTTEKTKRYDASWDEAEKMIVAKVS